jgi:hypothetical protein
MFYLHFYNMIFKIKCVLCITSGSAPPPAPPKCAPGTSCYRSRLVGAVTGPFGVTANISLFFRAPTKPVEPTQNFQMGKVCYVLGTMFEIPCHENLLSGSAYLLLHTPSRSVLFSRRVCTVNSLYIF